MCEICLKIDCPPSCPNYVGESGLGECDYCGCQIVNGDEYIMNVGGKMMHLYCAEEMPIKEFAEWCYAEIHTYEED